MKKNKTQKKTEIMSLKKKKYIRRVREEKKNLIVINQDSNSSRCQQHKCNLKANAQFIKYIT